LFITGGKMDKLSQALLSKLREKALSRSDFRNYTNQLALCLAHKAAELLNPESVRITTPLGQATGIAFKKPIMLVPILRSGITLLPAFLTYFPESTVGVVGMKRDEETSKADLYYKNIPSFTQDTVIIVLDPMIATGGSAIDTLRLLDKCGMQQEQTIFVGVIASLEGVAAVQTAFPLVRFIIEQVDEKLNNKKFIVPGLGDWGDRYFGTE